MKATLKWRACHCHEWAEVVSTAAEQLTRHRYKIIALINKPVWCVMS